MSSRSRQRRKARLATVAAGAVLAVLAAGPSFADPSAQTPIKHVVVIFGENISFGHYFGTYPLAANPKNEPRFVAAEDTPSANTLLDAGLLTNNPNLRQPFRLKRTEAFTCDMDHDYTDEQKAVDAV
ncbi:MAG TPA: alkaline phosphatase family protein [Stellaceae bacterium]